MKKLPEFKHTTEAINFGVKWKGNLHKIKLLRSKMMLKYRIADGYLKYAKTRGIKKSHYINQAQIYTTKAALCREALETMGEM